MKIWSSNGKLTMKLELDHKQNELNLNSVLKSDGI